MRLEIEDVILKRMRAEARVLRCAHALVELWESIAAGNRSTSWTGVTRAMTSLRSAVRDWRGP